MPNPPITIGPFDNVPAPGSPIRSDWTQEITNYVVGRTAIFGQPATVNPPGGVDINVLVFTAITGITWDVVVPAGGGRVSAVVILSGLHIVTADVNGQAQLTIGGVSAGAYRVRRSLAASPAANRFDLTFVGSRAGVAAGPCTIRPELRLVAAGGAIRADTESAGTLITVVSPA